MRLTKEAHPKTGKNVSGVRKCDRCGKEEFVAKPRRWDICISCLRKELHKTGKNVAPKYFKKLTPVNFCKNCNKCFNIGCEYYRNQSFCSSKCSGVLRKNIPPANKIWGNLEDRTKHYYEKYKADPVKWLARLVRNRAKAILKTQTKRKNAKYKNLGDIEEIIGCKVEFLMKHIENQFEPEMNWDNWGLHGWHIDHIYPISRFNLLDREELLKACNYKNLRPLWATENRKKHAKVIIELEEIMNKEYDYEC
jgi:hypothetical protein